MEDAGQAAGILPNLCTPRSLLLVVVTAQLFAIVLTLAAYSSPTWADLGLISLYVLWTALISAAALCLLRHYTANWPVWGVALTAWLVIVFSAMMVSLIADWLITYGLGVRWPVLNTSERWQETGRRVLIAAIIGAVFLRYFYLQYSYRERLAAEAKARLEALHARIRPHFLFNTLNTIAELLYQDTQLAEKALHALAKMFRASLTDPGVLVPWSQEQELSEHYLMLEKWRLGARLQVNWQVPDSEQMHHVMVPALILQPLLENAIVHGISRSPSGGTIHVKVELKHEKLFIEVRNPLRETVHTEGGHGIALENIKARLRWLYGLEGGLEIHQNDNAFCVRLSLPVVRTESKRRRRDES